MMKDMVGLVAWQILIIHYRHKELWKMKSLYNVISRQKIPKVLRFLLHSDISFAFWPLFILIIWLAVTYIKKKRSSAADYSSPNLYGQKECGNCDATAGIVTTLRPRWKCHSASALLDENQACFHDTSVSNWTPTQTASALCTLHYIG